jgi:hypothetical protein
LVSQIRLASVHFPTQLMQTVGGQVSIGEHRSKSEHGGSGFLV